MTQIDNFIKEEFKRYETKRKYCAQHYDDYADDEYNCCEMKFIFGIKSKEDHSNNSPSFETLNDVVIYYNRDTGYYCADIDLPSLEDSEMKEYLETINSKMTEYMETNNYVMPYKEIMDTIGLTQLKSTKLPELCEFIRLIINGARALI